MRPPRRPKQLHRLAPLTHVPKTVVRLIGTWPNSCTSAPRPSAHLIKSDWGVACAPPPCPTDSAGRPCTSPPGVGSSARHVLTKPAHA